LQKFIVLWICFEILALSVQNVYCQDKSAYQPLILTNHNLHFHCCLCLVVIPIACDYITYLDVVELVSNGENFLYSERFYLKRLKIFCKLINPKKYKKMKKETYTWKNSIFALMWSPFKNQKTTTCCFRLVKFKKP
jgi:hypothetical protein